MHSSDETGDERKGLASTGGAADGETAKLPAHAFRERIRRASVAAAQASAPANASTATAASTGPHSIQPALLVPEQSGVHDRSSETPPEAANAKSPQSSAPDETSETIAKTGKALDASAIGVPKQSSNAWPFAGGHTAGHAGNAEKDERRLHHHTQLGIGMPQRSAAAGNPRASETAKSDADSEVSDSRRRMDTRDTKRSGAPVPARPPTGPRASKSVPPPPPSKSTPPRPFRAPDAKWSPTSTKPQRASLLRADAPKEEQQRAFTQTLRQGPRAKAGAEQHAQAKPQELASYTLSALADEYLEVSVDAHGLSISATDSSDDQHSQDAQIVEPSAQESATEAASGEGGARVRRYTPKQRGRSRERGDERAEYAPTIPDLRPTFTPINKTVRGAGPQQAQPSVPPSLPGGSNQLHLSHLGAIDPASKLAHLTGHELTGQGSPPVTPDTPTQPRGKPVPRLPLVASPQLFSTKPAFAHPAAFNNARQPQAPAVLPAPRSPFAPASTQRGASANYGQQHEASIVVDPSLNAQVTERAPQRADVRPIQQPYQPLPSDPAAFEQMMRDQAAARGARLNWKQQATLVIPREELEAPTEQRLITPKMIAGFIGATFVGALIMLAIGRYGDSASIPGKGTDTSTSAAASSNTVVIATEPSGAELLLDGAVVGNTPLEVPRPPRGQAELTYVIRMRGFTQELIRLSAESQPAIRVTLTPDSGGVQ